MTAQTELFLQDNEKDFTRWLIWLPKYYKRNLSQSSFPLHLPVYHLFVIHNFHYTTWINNCVQYKLVWWTTPKYWWTVSTRKTNIDKTIDKGLHAILKKVASDISGPIQTNTSWSSPPSSFSEAASFALFFFTFLRQTYVYFLIKLTNLLWTCNCLK